MSRVMARAARTEASAADCFSACGAWCGSVWVCVAGLIGESYRVWRGERVERRGLSWLGDIVFL